MSGLRILFLCYVWCIVNFFGSIEIFLIKYLKRLVLLGGGGRGAGSFVLGFELLEIGLIFCLSFGSKCCRLVKRRIKVFLLMIVVVLRLV